MHKAILIVGGSPKLEEDFNKFKEEYTNLDYDICTLNLRHKEFSKICTRTPTYVHTVQQKLIPELLKLGIRVYAMLRGCGFTHELVTPVSLVLEGKGSCACSAVYHASETLNYDEIYLVGVTLEDTGYTCYKEYFSALPNSVLQKIKFKGSLKL